VKYDVRKHHRRSIRLRGYDYAHAGAYFVTVCARERECLFGTVVDGAMRLNENGAIVDDWWRDIPRHFPRVDIDAHIIMPNHMHGIVVIDGNDPIGPTAVGAGSPRPGSPRPGLPGVKGGGGTQGEETRGEEPRGGETRGGETRGGETPPLQEGEYGGGRIAEIIVGAGSPRPVKPPTLGQIVAYFKYQSSKAIAAAREMPGVPVWQRNYYEHIIRSEESLDKIRWYITENPARWAFDRENPAAATPEPENAWRAEFLGNLDLEDLP